MINIQYLRLLGSDGTGIKVMVSGTPEDLEAFVTELNARVAQDQNLTTVTIPCFMGGEETLHLDSPLATAVLAPLTPSTFGGTFTNEGDQLNLTVN